MKAINAMLQSHKLSCITRRKGNFVCSCGRDQAAESELAAMQARIEKLEAVRKAAQSHMDFHGKPKGISKTNDDLLDALAECGK